MRLAKKIQSKEIDTAKDHEQNRQKEGIWSQKCVQNKKSSQKHKAF